MAVTVIFVAVVAVNNDTHPPPPKQRSAESQLKLPSRGGNTCGDTAASEATAGRDRAG